MTFKFAEDAPFFKQGQTVWVDDSEAVVLEDCTPGFRTALKVVYIKGPLKGIEEIPWGTGKMERVRKTENEEADSVESRTVIL